MNQILPGLMGHLLVVGPAVLVAAAIGLVVTPLVRRRPAVGLVADRVALVGMVVPVLAFWVLLPLLTGLPLRSVVHLWIALGWCCLPVVMRVLLATDDHRASARAARALGRGPGWRLMCIHLPVILPAVADAMRRCWLLVVPVACVAGLFTDHGLGAVMMNGHRSQDPSLIAAALGATVLLAWLGAVLLAIVGRVLGRRDRVEVVA